MSMYLRPSFLKIEGLLGLEKGAIDFGERKRFKKGTFNPSIPSFLGIYGYNGSGKSALIYSLRLLSSFFQEKEDFALRKELIHAKASKASIVLDTLLMDDCDPLGFLTYELTIHKERKGKSFGEERFTYQKEEGKKLGKKISFLRKRSLSLKGTALKEQKDPYSQIFYETIKNHLSFYPLKEESSPYSSLICGNKIEEKALMPFEERLLSSLPIMSSLLPIPLSIKVKKEEGKAYFILEKEGKELPYLQESEGTRKLLSLFLPLSAYLSSSKEWVILDEVDAGIFEYLFGELMKSLYIRGKGSLIFTSHNLRTLETLPHHHARFASLLVAGRFFELSVRKGANLRDAYLRSLALKEEYPGEDIPSFMRRASKLGKGE